VRFKPNPPLERKFFGMGIVQEEEKALYSFETDEEDRGV